MRSSQPVHALPLGAAIDSIKSSIKSLHQVTGTAQAAPPRPHRPGPSIKSLAPPRRVVGTGGAADTGGDRILGHGLIGLSWEMCP